MKHTDSEITIAQTEINHDKRDFIKKSAALTTAAAIMPIKEIVVGPHRDKLRRQQAVQMLLEELEIQAEVRVSDIPFLGR